MLFVRPYELAHPYLYYVGMAPLLASTLDTGVHPRLESCSNLQIFSAIPLCEGELLAQLHITQNKVQSFE